MATKTERLSGLTPQEARSLLSYNPETGKFNWKVDRRCGANNRIFRKAGAEAGGLTSSGYVVICINYHRLYAHRLAWFMTHGDWPERQIDHIDLNRRNNSIANLRPADGRQNRCNQRARAASGFKGVTKHSQADVFVAQITVNGENIYLGTFKSPNSAHQAYCEAARRYHGDYMRAA